MCGSMSVLWRNESKEDERAQSTCVNADEFWSRLTVLRKEGAETVGRAQQIQLDLPEEEVQRRRRCTERERQTRCWWLLSFSTHKREGNGRRGRELYKSIELPSFIIDVTGNPATAKLVPETTFTSSFHEMKRHIQHHSTRSYRVSLYITQSAPLIFSLPCNVTCVFSCVRASLCVFVRGRL